jgi:hypothetical protein
MRALIGNRFGTIIAEVVGDIDSTSWILNGIGKSGLTLAKSDANVNEETLRINNRIYMEFDNGLPAWGGILAMPRDWTPGTVHMAAYTIEEALKTRHTRKTDAFYERPAGVIFRELLLQEEVEDPLGITIGEIWQGGNPHWPRYHYKSLWYVLDYSLRRMEICDFKFTPYLDNGVIKFRTDFYQVAGDDKSGTVELTEGRNTASGLKLREQGSIINKYTSVSEGSTWGPERSVVIARYNESVAKYGLMEQAKVHAGVSQVATLEMHARNAINTHAEPRKLFTLPVVDQEPARYAAYGLGDTIRATLPSFGFDGFDGTLRVLGREFDPATGECELVVEEPRTFEPLIQDEDIDVEEAT